MPEVSTIKKCRRCRMPAEVGVLCPRHKDQARRWGLERARRLGSREWQPGGKGRPPKVAQEIAERFVGEKETEFTSAQRELGDAKLRVVQVQQRVHQLKAELRDAYRDALALRTSRSRLIKRKPTKFRRPKFGPMAEVWPFLQHDTNDQLIQDINAMVTRGIPEDVRQEVCQEVALLMLANGTPLSKALVAQCLENIRQAYPVASGRQWSLEDLVPNTDGLKRIDSLSFESLTTPWHLAIQFSAGHRRGSTTKPAKL